MSRDEIRNRGAQGAMQPVLQRLRTQTPISAGLASRIEALGTRIEAAAARTTLQEENLPVLRPRYLIHGWACRFRYLPDGRRQIFDLILPGEGVGLCLRAHPLALTGIATLTSVRLVDAAPLIDPVAVADFPELLPALQTQADLGERRLLDQVVRLGRLTASERLAHLLLDLHERLDVVGLVAGDRYELPLTQEVLADVAGLSVVHVNRTLQELRRQNLVEVGRGQVRIPDQRALRQAAQLETAQSSLRIA